MEKLSQGELKYRIMQRVYAHLEAARANKFAVNYDENTAVFENLTENSYYLGTIYFSKDDSAICMEIKLPVRIQKPYMVALEHHIMKETSQWFTEAVHVTSNAISFHGYITIGDLKERVNNLLCEINDLPLPDEEKEAAAKKVIENLLPSVNMLKELEQGLMLKILLYEDDIYAIASGLPVDVSSEKRRKPKQRPHLPFDGDFLFPNIEGLSLPDIMGSDGNQEEEQLSGNDILEAMENAADSDDRNESA